MIDGNVDRDFISTALRAVGDGSVAAVGVTVMGGPQLLFGNRRVEGNPRETARGAYHLGRRFPDRLSGSDPERAIRRLRRKGAGRGHASSSFWMRSLSAGARRWTRFPG